jgi:hypothetical protein
MLRLRNERFNPNVGAGALDRPDGSEVVEVADILSSRVLAVTETSEVRDLATAMFRDRIDEWSAEANRGGRVLAYEKKGPAKAMTVALLKKPGAQAWDEFTVPMSMREVEPGVRLVMNTVRYGNSAPAWMPQPIGGAGDSDSDGDTDGGDDA